MRELPSMADNETIKGYVLAINNRQSIQHPNHKHRSLANPRPGLTQQILALQYNRYSILLHFTRSLEPHLPYPFLDLLLQVHITPAHQGCTDVVGPMELVNVYFLLIGVFVVRHIVGSHCVIYVIRGNLDNSIYKGN